jgi:hypothetical protein
MTREPASRKPGQSGAASTTTTKFVAPAPWAIVVALLGVTLVVQRHTLHQYFALDDLILFQQAGGIRPWPHTLWRWLSGWAWFRMVVPLWGHEPFPYHAMSLAVHAVNVLLLHRLARRWGASPVAAFVGAGLFAASRLHFPALLAATSIGELLSLTGTLAALLLLAPGPRMALAIAAFALALSAKESVMLVPFAALFIARGEAPWRERVRTLAPLLASSMLLGVGLLFSGVGSGRLGGQAYGVSFGANLFENVARLFGWSVDLVDPIPDLHATTEGLAHVVLPVVAIACTLLAFSKRGTAVARAGAAWWWLAVLPVLPLPGRTYLFYLYVPLAGVALVSAALWDGALAWRAGRTHGSRGSGRAAWVAALAVLGLYAVWSDVLLSVRQDLRMAATGWPLDPVLRKSEIARRGIGDVSTALAGRHARVAILIPASISHDVDLGSGRVSADTPVKRYALVSTLDDGRSLRAMVPAADSVVFVHDYESGRDGWQYFLSRSDSHLVPLGELPDAHARFVQAMLASGFAAAALDYAEKALADHPNDAALRSLREQAVAAVAATPH